MSEKDYRRRETLVLVLTISILILVSVTWAIWYNFGGVR